MVTLYADLIELGLRVLESPREGEIAVPAFLRDGVRKELVKRGVINAA